MSQNNQYIITAVLLLTLALLLALGVGTESGRASYIRIGVGAVCLLFLPGYRVTRAIYSEEKQDSLETLALSFAFSISVVPLLVFYLNIIGLPIGERLVWSVMVLVIAGSIGYMRRQDTKGIRQEV